MGAKSKPISIMFDGKLCCYCNRSMDMADPDLCPTRDHYPIPKSQGGRKTLIACARCNNMKADMSADEWQTFMRENPEWWNLSYGNAEVARKDVRRFRRPQPEKQTSAIGDQLTALGIVRRIAEDFDKVFPKEGREDE